MLALVVVKALSVLFHGVDYHFISLTGKRDEGWAITWVLNATHRMRTGWGMGSVLRTRN